MKCEMCLSPLSKVINCNLCNKTMCSSQCTLSHFTQWHNNKTKTDDNQLVIPHKFVKASPSLIQMSHSPSLITKGVFLQSIQYDPQFSIDNFTPVYSKNHQVVLGRGTFGQVSLVKHNLNENFYAMKHMKKDKLMMALNSLSTIYNEINIHSRLVHSNIIKILNVNETSEAFDLIMEYANGGSLFGLIKRSRGLSEKNAHKYFFQVANAINFLHENNILHRDLKPENILLDANDNDQTKLCDFGWSIELSSRNRSTYCGTMEYMAPEIVNKGNYDKAVDIWSLGVLLYELIHGYSPFRAIYNYNDSNEVVANIKSMHFKFDKTISEECKSMINELLNDDPSKRLKCADIFTHPFALKYPIDNKGLTNWNQDANDNDMLPRSNSVINNIPVCNKRVGRQKSISICNKEWVNQQLNNPSIGNSHGNNRKKEANVNAYAKANDAIGNNEITKMKAMIRKQKSIQLTNVKERISQINLEKKDNINCFEDILMAYSSNKKKTAQGTSSTITSIANNKKRSSVESLLPELFDNSSSSTASSIKQPNKIIKVFDMKTKIGKEKEKKHEKLSDLERKKEERETK